MSRSVESQSGRIVSFDDKTGMLVIEDNVVNPQRLSAVLDHNAARELATELLSFSVSQRGLPKIEVKRVRHE